MRVSPGFRDWLVAQRISLAVSTYQSGRLFLIGPGPGPRLWISQRAFPRSMGLWSDTQSLWLASAFQLWRLENALEAGQRQAGCDRLFVPRAAFTTGDVDAHDVAVEASGRVVLVSSRFSCLATLSPGWSIQPFWQPWFVTRMAPDDRCHLNGVALVGGRCRYVTVCGQTDAPEAWRAVREEGGAVLDVDGNEPLATGLSMPHSPRFDGSRLWLLESGRGRLGWIDPSGGRFEPVAFCPGYARGLAFSGRYAVVGVSKPRRGRTFVGLPLDDELARRRERARCGLLVIDRDSGRLAHWLQIVSGTDELYDVVLLPDVSQPRALACTAQEVRHRIWFEWQGQRYAWRRRAKPTPPDEPHSGDLPPDDVARESAPGA